MIVQMIYKKYSPTNREKKKNKTLRIAYALLQTNRKLLPSYKPSHIFFRKKKKIHFQMHCKEFYIQQLAKQRGKTKCT